MHVQTPPVTVAFVLAHRTQSFDVEPVQVLHAESHPTQISAVGEAKKPVLQLQLFGEGPASSASDDTQVRQLIADVDVQVLQVISQFRQLDASGRGKYSGSHTHEVPLLEAPVLHVKQLVLVAPSHDSQVGWQRLQTSGVPQYPISQEQDPVGVLLREAPVLQAVQLVARFEEHL